MLATKQNRYDLMHGQQIDDDPTIWPDCLSIDLDNFPNTQPGLNAFVYQDNVLRPDMFFYHKLGTNNLEDIILWINTVSSRRDLEAGMSLLLPAVTDLNSYYIANRRLD
jgi:hypothetical protein